MSDVTVTVSGMGTVISHEMILIRRALEAAGITVNVVDGYPVPRQREDVYLAHRKDLLDPNGEYAKKNGKPIPSVVTLIADHQPWGG